MLMGETHKCSTCGKKVDEWSGIKSLVSGKWYCLKHDPRPFHGL
jgi:hypothetical protein